MNQAVTEYQPDVSVNIIFYNKKNPRKMPVESLASQKFMELRCSIEAVGVCDPVDLREHPKKKGKYELLAGERRLKAAKTAGVKTIPAIIHHGLTDAEAFEITLLENFGREDLTVNEQSKAIAELLKLNKGDTKVVATKMGQSERWVMQRANVFNNLSDRVLEEVEAKEIANWNLSLLCLLARFPKNTQNEIIGYLQYQSYTYPPYNDRALLTTTKLEKEIARFLKVLRLAPWSLDKQLEGDGRVPCVKCHKRTSYKPNLWDDDLSLDEIKKNDRCLDPECWKAKETIHLKTQRKSLSKEYPGLTIIASKEPAYPIGKEIKKEFGHYTPPSMFDASKKDAKGAVPALVVHGTGVGTLRFVKIREKPRGTSSAASSGGSKPKPTPLKERRENFKKKRWIEVLRQLIEKVGQADCQDLDFPKKKIGLIALASQFGTTRKADSADSHIGTDGYYVSGRGKYWEYFWDAAGSRKPEGDAINALWLQVRGVLTARLKYIGPIKDLPNAYVKEAGEVCKLLGLDVVGMFKEVCKSKGFIEPKAWASLNEDGTPKTKELERGAVIKQSRKKRKQTKKAKRKGTKAPK